MSPTVRRVTGALLAVLTLQALAVLCFAYPPSRVAPHDLPVGVAGPPTAADAIARGLTGRGEGALEVRRYADEPAARAAVADRQVYGAIVAAPGAPKLLIASGASPTVATLLQQAVATQAPAGQPAPAVQDVAPADPDDPRQAALATGLLPVVLTGAAGGFALTMVAGSAMAVAGGLLVFAVLGSGVVTGIIAGWLGALPADLTTATVFGLTLLAVGATTAALVRLLGTPGFGLAALTFLLIGNVGSGAQSAPELLPQPWRALGPYLPPGAGVDLLRGTAFFDGASTAFPLAVLLTWAAVGLAALAVPRRRGSAAGTTPERDSRTAPTRVAV